MSPPASAPFPDSYANNFEDAALNSEAPYLSDQAGKWEVRAEKSILLDDAGASSSAPNQVLSQVCVEQGVVYRASPLHSFAGKFPVFTYFGCLILCIYFSLLRHILSCRHILS